MRNVLVLGFFGFGFLLGCMNNNYDQASARETAERIGTFRYLCENEQGIQDETPEMTACITKMNQQTPRNVVTHQQTPRSVVTQRQNNGEALMRMGAAMYSCAIHGTTPDPVTGICSPPPPRQQGNVYDNSGRLIGTYVEN